jgi:8-oxo-dGDP phosphatase
MDADPRADAPGGRPDPAESPWRTLAARRVYSNLWLSLTEYEVMRPDGQRGIYGIVDPGPNATIVALDEQEQVRLVGDFVYPLQRHMWGLPSGKVEENETPLAAAQRELAEEAGVEAAEWLPLGTYDLSPGIMTQVSHIFLARGLRDVTARPDGTERFALRALPLREALDACLRGELRSAVTVLGIWRAWAYLHGIG